MPQPCSFRPPSVTLCSSTNPERARPVHALRGLRFDFAADAFLKVKFLIPLTHLPRLPAHESLLLQASRIYKEYEPTEGQTITLILAALYCEKEGPAYAEALNEVSHDHRGLGRVS